MAVKLQNVLAPALPQPCQGVKTPQEERLAASLEPWGFHIAFHPQQLPGILSQKTHVHCTDILCPVFSGVVGDGKQNIPALAVFAF